MQRRKSRPRVVVEEYVHDDAAENSSDSDDNFGHLDEKADKKSLPSPIKIEEKKASESSIGHAGATNLGSTLIKVKTHMSIDDFSDLVDDKIKHVGMAEISPLERHMDNLEKTV